MSRMRYAIAAAILVSTMWAKNAAPPAPKSGAAPATTPPPDSISLVLVQRTRPVYPLSDEKDPLQGQVVVKITTSETGDVESTEVVSGNPLLAAAAVDAVKQWKVKPFIRSGKPVKASTTILFNFIFRDRAVEPSGAAAGDSAEKDRAAGISEGMTSVMVSQKMAATMLVHKVQPIYPDLAKTARIQGTVLLFAVISKEGTVKDLRLISGHPLLTQPSADAVKQSRYKPYFLRANLSTCKRRSP